MAIIAGVGRASGHDAYEVGVLAAQEAAGRLGGQAAELVIVFSSVAYDQEKVLQGVRSVMRDARVVGCSTAGEITTEGPAEQNSVVIMVLSGGGALSFSVGVGEEIAPGAEQQAGAAMAKAVTEAMGGKQMKSFIMLADGLAGNGADIVRGVLSVVGANFPVVGGSAGDDFQFKQTYEYLDDKVYSKAVVGVGISGDFGFGIGVKHGWGTIGVPAKVTRSVGNVLYELDGKPALSIYEKYFGSSAQQLREEALAKLAITYPLGLKVEGSDELLIRDPITVDEAGAITCAAEIPEGSEIRLMIGSKEAAVEMARKAAEDAKSMLDGKTPKAIVIFNCIARKKLFGAEGGDEIRAIQSVLGREVPLIGFYTYGEQAPLGGEVRNIERCNTVFHNETVVIYVIAE